MTPNVFDSLVSAALIDRINELTPNTQRLWGKMTVDQMLAHCNVTYEMIYEEGKHPKPGAFMKMILKLLVKNVVVNDKPYKPNNKTAPAFLITEPKDFEAEKARLIGYIHTTQMLGAMHFDGKVSHSFGALTGGEWNNMFYKHLDHHLKQFGV